MELLPKTFRELCCPVLCSAVKLKVIFEIYGSYYYTNINSFKLSTVTSKYSRAFTGSWICFIPI